MLEQEIQREGQQAACRFVPGDQERDDLEPDVLVVERLPRVRVLAVQHVRKQIVFARGTVRFALGNDFIDQRKHEFDIVTELPLRQEHQLILNAEPLQLVHRFSQRPHHARNERMRLLPIKAVEAVIESAQADRIERQTRHILGNVHAFVGIQPRPFLDELHRQIDHFVMIAAHGRLTEARQQDIVRLPPVGLLRLAGKQAVSGERPHLLQRRPHSLIEPRLVTGVGDQLVAGDDQIRPSRQFHAVDRPELIGQLDQRLHRALEVKQRQIAQRSERFRLRNRCHQ